MHHQWPFLSLHCLIDLDSSTELVNEDCQSFHHGFLIFHSLLLLQVGADPMSNLKARYKLEEAVRKTKATLSANSEAPVSVECLMEDEDLGGLITRQECVF